MPPPLAPRGLDGLTADELRASRRGAWDDRFTQLLLAALGPPPSLLLDVGCGLATAAHALLPHLPASRYLGVDADPARLAEAAELLAGAPYADRVVLHAGRAERLPCGDGEAGAILFAMTLQHLADPAAALVEARRALAPGGALVAVEPDNLGQRFYLDGPLEAVDTAFAGLAAAARAARRPADSAIGPAVPALAERAGFERVVCMPHLMGGLRPASAAEVLAAAGRVADIVAAGAGLPAGDPRLARLRAALAAAVAGRDPGATAWGGQVVPVFITSARRGA